MTQEEEDTVKQKWDHPGHRWKPLPPVTRLARSPFPQELGSLPSPPSPGPPRSDWIPKDCDATPKLLPI